MPVVSLPVAIDATLKASLVLAITSVVAATLRRSSASARHLVWTLGLVSALATPALSIVTPHWQLPIVRIAAAAEVPAPTAAPPPAADQTATPALQAAATQRLPEGGRAAVSRSRDRISVASGFSQKISWTSFVVFIWAAGAAVVLGRMLLGLIAVRWMSRSTTVITDAAWIDQARSLAAALGLRRVRFLRTRTKSMPMAWGVFRSSVLFPQDADAWPADRLRIVLLHELAHVKRRDCLTHLVAQVACAVYWFNPLAWMAARRLRTERERACDDLVLAHGTRGSDYADQLLEIARAMRAGRFPAVLAGATLAMAHRSQLEGRLMAILDPSISRRGLTRMRAVIAAALFAMLIVPVAAVQPWASEPAALTGRIDPMAQTVTKVSQSDRPIESYPGEAAADARRNAEQHTVVQDDLQGRVQGAVQGGVAGGIQGGVSDGIQGGVAGGIRDGVPEGMRDAVRQGVGFGVGTGVGVGVDNGVATSVVFSVAHGMANGIADAVVRNLPEVQRDDTAGALAGARGQRASTADPRAVNALTEALKDTDKGVRDAAMQALVQMRDPRILEPLIAALRDASADIRQQAAFGLGQLRDARAVQPLAAAVKDQNADVRQQAIFALGQIRAAEAVDAIAPALHDTSETVRDQAAFALGQIRDARAVEPLVSALKDQKADVRQQAAFALGQIRSSKAVDALVIALKDSVTEVREQAAFALGQIRDPRAIDGLTQALKDASATVRQQAAFALGQIR